MVARFFNVLTLCALAFATTGAPATAAEDTAPRLLILGDSLTAGYGLPAPEAFPARLEAALAARGHDVHVLASGVSGDTTAGGLARLDWVLADKPDLAIVELGANDALRGIDPETSFGNLDRIIARLKDAGVRVILAGMYAPPNWGREYTDEFNAIYPRLAEKHDVMLYPFFLEGVATVPALNQGDGIHPNAEGVQEIVDRITPYVVRLLRNLQQG